MNVVINLQWHTLSVLILTLLCGFTNSLENNSPTISLSQGKLQGTSFQSRNGRSYFGFLGIPYAHVHQRFEEAKPDPDWGDIIYDATLFGPVCYQFTIGITDNTIIGSEDCLSINVYSPELKADSKLPVMVFFHGGGFAQGANQHYDAKYFMDEDVVLVTVNYRLGILGFLSTGDDALSGNLGMKDQVLALKWVQKNIEHFGGNPTKVTIFGQSAGGAAVGYHMISPLSSGLFHRAMSFGGSSLVSWSLQRNPLKYAKILAKHVGCPMDTSKMLVSCLKTKTPEELLSGQQQFNEWLIFPNVPMAPVVENVTGDATVFLSQSPYELLTSGKFEKVPYLLGITQDEGLAVDLLVRRNETLLSQLDTEWFRLAPLVLNYEDTADKEQWMDIAVQIREFYFEDEEIGESSSSSLNELISDRYFNHGVYKAALLHSKQARVYPYLFSFPGDYSMITSFFGIKGQYGVAHADELQYLFNGVYNAPEYNGDTELREFSQNFVKLLVSFAESGKPTATWGPETSWKPVAPHKPLKWYQIDIKTNIWEDDLESRLEFWESLPLQEFKNEKRNFKKDEL